MKMVVGEITWRTMAEDNMERMAALKKNNDKEGK